MASYSVNHHYRNHRRRVRELFKNSEYNLDDQDEFVDKEYYDKDGLLK